jgi:hypothetical protein
MPKLPPEFAPIILAFALLFRKASTWKHAQVLLLGAILAPGKRTVTSALRILGLSAERHFQNYHRVLNRAVWIPRHASLILLRLLLAAFAPSGPIVLGLDDTIERRRGERISARGIYRDPVRSSHSHFVKTGGLRWLALMLLVPVPFAQRLWALPFLTALAPSERYYQKRRGRHKALTDWARQMLLQVRRWLPDRTLVMVADGGFAALDLLARLASLRRPITCVTRLRLDARLYQPPPRRRPTGAPGRPRLKGARLPSLQQRWENPRTRWTRLRVAHWYGQTARWVEIVSGTAIWYHGGLPPLSIRWVLIRDPKGRFDPLALLCTDPSQSPAQIVQWFVWRWQVEVTFQQVRTHLGFETQRQWSDSAIARTSPTLLALFSLITLLASALSHQAKLPVPKTAWYEKTQPTFSDAIAAVRQRLWRNLPRLIPMPNRNRRDPLRILLDRFSEALCFAA